MRRRPLLALVCAVGVGTSGLACSSSDGRDLPPPRVAQTTTTPSAPIVQAPDGSAEPFRLASPAFVDLGEIPAQFTCRGEGRSPALAWSGTPPDTTSLALVVRDLDAGGFVHWVVTGIDTFAQSVGEDGLPESAIEGLNSAGTNGWTPPCPPAGSGVHDYEFALLALLEPVTLPLDAPAAEAAATLEAAAAERAVLTGTVAAP